MRSVADQTEDNTSSVRKQRRLQEDRKRMAYRRAIEQYRESQALHAQVCDFPELTETRRPRGWLHGPAGATELNQ